MNKKEMQKIDELTLDLYENLCILKSAIACFDKNLEVSDLVSFSEQIFQISNEIREIFNNSTS